MDIRKTYYCFQLLMHFKNSIFFARVNVYYAVLHSYIIFIGHMLQVYFTRTIHSLKKNDTEAKKKALCKYLYYRNT